MGASAYVRSVNKFSLPAYYRTANEHCERSRQSFYLGVFLLSNLRAQKVEESPNSTNPSRSASTANQHGIHYENLRGRCMSRQWATRSRRLLVALFKYRNGRIKKAYGARLPSYPIPTNQRAEITAIILALDKAYDVYESLDRPGTKLDIKIFSDSQYAVSCLNGWIFKWLGNGWMNAAGRPVVNRDLIEMADDLRDKLGTAGRVRFHWVPREDNVDADAHCNDILDDCYSDY